MRGVLLAGGIFSVLAFPAIAADLSNVKEPVPYALPAFSWTGVYIGGQAGYAWGRSNGAIFAPGGIYDFSVGAVDNGFRGGVHIGYNEQVDAFVIGLEGDANGATYTGSTINSSSSYLYQTRIPIDGSIRGRAGYAFDRVLLYATGGAAFAEIKSNVTEFSTGALDQDRPGRVGWTLGAGVEYSIDNNWSVRAEYRYTDYGHYSYTLVNTTSDPDTFRVHETDNRIQAGFSYKFDRLTLPPVPLITKY